MCTFRVDAQPGSAFRLKSHGCLGVHPTVHIELTFRVADFPPWEQPLPHLHVGR